MFLIKKGIKLRTAHTKTGIDNVLSKGGNSGDNAVKEALKVILDCLEEAKANDTISIDISAKSSIGDYMIVTSGHSNRHVRAICDQLLKDLKHAGMMSVRVEGQGQGDWVLVDCGDIIIHVFRPETRQFYNIEKMWTAPESDEKTLHYVMS